MNSIFDYSEYKPFLKAYLASQPKKGHGLRSLWAEALSCNSAYLSQVLNHHAHLNLEQAAELCEQLLLRAEEGQYFLLLVQKARSGTRKLDKHFQNEIDKILNERRLLRNRVDIKENLQQADQIKYYSSWQYAGIHMAVTLDRINSKNDLIEHFKIPAHRISEILDFLESCQLINNTNGKYTTGKKRIFLGSNSPLISKHHTNWRIKAIESLELVDDTSLHLSTVLTMSKSDLEKVREEILKGIENARELVKQTTKEEEIVCLNVDLFHL